MAEKLYMTLRMVFDVFFFTFLYIGGALTLEADYKSVITISGASIAGSAVLAYFRRDRDYKEIFFKSACASIVGLVMGAIITKRWEIDSTEYVVGVYFFASLLSIFIIKGLLTFTEQNAVGMVFTIFQKFLPSQNGTQLIKTEIAVTKDGETIQKTGEKENEGNT